MNTDQFADTLAMTTITLLLGALLVWLLIALPFWSALIVFALLGFFTLAFIGPAIALAAYGIALILQCSHWTFTQLKQRFGRA